MRMQTLLGNIGDARTRGYALLLLTLVAALVSSGCVGVAGSGGNPPAVTISNPSASNINSTGATITWITNVPADSQVDYGTTPSYGQSSALNPALVTSHSVVLSGLTPSTLYHYQVRSKDSAGRSATSGDFTFTTASGGNPPVISGVTATNISTTGATVSWITDKLADSQVDYGTTTSYGSSTPLDSNLVMTHSQGLSGLTPGTLYHYRVRSKDGAGNQATSGDNTFATAGSGGSDFQARCSAPGVVRCIGFDSPADIAGVYGDNTGVVPGEAVVSIDTTVFASGGGSLHFFVPAGMSGNADYFANFTPDLSVQFDSCNATPTQCEFYVQWRQRFDAGILNSGGSGFKQAIITQGDEPGFPVSSCQDIGVITQNSYTRGFPQMYHSCGVKDGLFEPLEEPIGSPPTNYFLENGIRSPGCLYSTSPANCFQYAANQWMTFQVHIKVGTWYSNNRVYRHDSIVQLWVAYEGQPSRLVFDFSPQSTPDVCAQNNPNISIPPCQTGYDLVNISPGPGIAKYGKVWFTPRAGTILSPVASNTWYDELIISRTRIRDPQ